MALPDRQVSLLRGINVGGRNIIAMNRLRALYESLGATEVATHLQSGNVVLRHDDEPATLSAAVRRAIRTTFDLDIPVLGRSGAEVAAIVERDPFPGVDPSRRLVVFLDTPPGPGGLPDLASVAAPGEEVLIVGREIFVSLPDGFAGSKLAELLLGRRLGVVATARNWRTVARLGELVSGSPLASA